MTNEKTLDYLQRGVAYIAKTVENLEKTVNQQNNQANKRLDVECAQLNSKNTFLKIKGNYFSIEKVLFSFVQFDDTTKKRIADIDVCLSFSEFEAFACDILNGLIFNAAAQEKAKGEKYPRAVYHSPLGGINEEKCRERKLRSDGKAISRSFNLAPGNRQPYIITAEQRPGKTDERGLIVPENGRPEIVIRVPATREMLIGAVELTNRHITAYLAGMYADKNSSFYYMPKQR